MTDQILVQLVADDAPLSAAAKKASANLDKLAKKEATKVKDQQKQAQALLKAQERQAKSEASAIAKNQKAWQSYYKKTDQNYKTTAAKNQRDQKRDFVNTGKLLRGDLSPSMSKFGVQGAIAGAAIGAIAVGAVVAATAIAGLTGAAVVLAQKFGTNKKEATATLDVLTDGRGAAALKLLDGLANQLGMKVQDVRDSFIEFRQAGLDNKQSAALIKLTADMKAAGFSAKMIEEAVTKTLDHKGGEGTLKQIELLAKQANVTGKGLLAADVAGSSFSGVMARLDNKKVEVLEKLWDRIGPVIDKVAVKFGDAITKFLDSEKGQAAIDKLGGAIEKLGNGAIWLVDNFSKVTSILVLVATLANLPLVALTAMATGIYKAVTGTLSLLPDSVKEIGKNIINGLISGITGMAGALASKVMAIADGVKNTFKSALKIQSPSKVFEGFGKMTGLGFEKGLEGATPDAEGVAETLTSGGPPGASSGRSGGSPMIVIENLNVPVGADPDAFARSVRRELASLLQAMQLSQGLPS
jgi:hypothetical protein